MRATVSSWIIRARASRIIGLVRHVAAWAFWSAASRLSSSRPFTRARMKLVSTDLQLRFRPPSSLATSPAARPFALFGSRHHCEWTAASTNRCTRACRRFQTLFSRSRRRARRRPRRPKCGWRLTPTISTSRSAAGRASRTRSSPTRCAVTVRTCGRATTSSPSASTRSTIAATRSTSSPTPSAPVRTDR